MSNRFKIKPLALATFIVAQGSTQFVLAQDNDGARIAEEEVQVTGFRRNLLQSQDIKRNSKNIVDAIVAEDIGKSTDQNIADALSRVTGVSIQSEDGEGTRITVRGANPNQNLITLNGVALGSSDFDQGVDLSAFSSDILAKIEVVKTPSADHDEGSLGATVNLTTAKPLDQSENIRNITLQGRYSDFAEKTDYKFSAVGSQKFFDDRFGVLVTVTDEQDSVRRDQLNVGRYQVVTASEATTLDGRVVQDFVGFAPESVQYQLHQNERTRQGADVTLQFLPTDTTDIALQLSYSKQKVLQSEDTLQVRPRNSSDRANYVEGVPHNMNPYQDLNPGDDYEYVPTFSDPQADWWTVDTENRTFVKQLNRFGDGSINHFEGGNETENKVANLQISQSLFDDTVRLDGGVNYSNVDFEFLENSRVSTSTWRTFSDTGVAKAGQVTDPDGIQPIGFDCDQNGIGCGIIFGDALASVGAFDNSHDNFNRTAFNPYDLDALYTGGAVFIERKIQDEQRAAWFDIDWDVDFLFFSTLEAGVKVSSRQKDVDDQRHRLEQANASVETIRLNDQGEPVGVIVEAGAALGDIPLREFFSDQDFPYDNFMRTLGAPASQITREGWQLVSSDAVFEKALSGGDLRVETNDTGTRGTELDNSALYVKANISLFDERLTGDIGLRRVKTEMENWGYSGLTFHSQGNRLNRLFDPFEWRALSDDTLPRCSATEEGRDYDTGELIQQDANGNVVSWGDDPTANPGGLQRQWLRIDGAGWYLPPGSDFSTTGDNAPVPIPSVEGDCHDPLTTLASFPVWRVRRHSDLSTEALVYVDDGTGTPVAEDRSRKNVLTQGSNTYSMNLPSLNLNYLFTDDIVGRFAVSRTMSRPDIDDLKPGFSLQEGVWAATPSQRTGNQITLSSPDLLPQKSDNLDLGVEWYFGDNNSISAVYFRKDLKDFLEGEEIRSRSIDVRNLDVSEGIDPTSLLMTDDEALDALANAADPYYRGVCMPTRAETGQINAQDWFASNDESSLDDELIKCAEFRVSTQRNGAEAEIQGVELGWVHNYTFLPGALSGLGSQMSYTYQESSTDAEVSTLDNETLLPEFPTEWTPKHSYNATVFWEQSGHQIRLAYRGKSDELISRSSDDGALWREGSSNLDLSATYKINENVSVDFNVINITDAATRNYWTSHSVMMGDTALVDGVETPVAFDEGNVQKDSGVTTSRTRMVYKTGARYRLGLRVKF